jgi:hypothetical protein
MPGGQSQARSAFGEEIAYTFPILHKARLSYENEYPDSIGLLLCKR